MNDKSIKFAPGAIVSVMVAVAVDRAYSYKVPMGMEVQRGSIVMVALGPRPTLGVVWGVPKDQQAHNRLKDIEHCFEVNPLSEELMKLVDWVARYTLAKPGMVLRGVLRSKEALDPPKPIIGYTYSGITPERMSNARSRVLEIFTRDEGAAGIAWPKSALIGESSVSASVVEGLVKVGSLSKVELPPSRAYEAPDVDFSSSDLNPHQKKALEEIRAANIEGKNTVLLDGVTGSGKTRIFFEAVADVLRQNKQILILLPEIALTQSFVDRFAERFGTKPAQWHSDVTPAQRAKVWRGVLNGDVRAVLGARSALFLPFSELGMIVLDEEHDGAFKQSDGVNYHARDMAVVRASLAGANVILSSATPSVESRNNANEGRYGHVLIKQRHMDAKLPDIKTIDMRSEGPEKGSWIAPELAREIFTTIDKGEQVLLFLNRRGYAPLTVCRSCGHQYQCADCSAWLVEHRFLGKLACHYCGQEIDTPTACTNCHVEGSLTAVGPGIERVAEEAASRFPEARQVILSSDMGSSAQIRQRFAEISNGDYDLIIGTQLVAKGHHFEKLTLVGVLDADLGLAHGDPRAAEKTFQLLTQVTGRAGRAAKSGRAYLQTYNPEHAVIKTMISGDREGFYAHELEVRKSSALPPFGRLAALIISASEHSEAKAYARHLLSKAPQGDGVRLFGPADAPILLVRGRYRVRILAQSAKQFDLSGYVRFWLEGANKVKGNLRVQVDIDPVSFY
ncbi:MAG: primosomal protein N' [Devosiaceae bacterium]|nr:primosomal protein N' [Devosiaceae bacterium]